MCMFSGRVRAVGGTRIFARPLADGRQVLAYAMNVAQDQELAMILPLPTPVDGGEDAVEFIDLSTAPELFTLLDGLFPEEVSFGLAARQFQGGPTLRVHQVGAFQASFVPTLADFDRLDPSFRMPAPVWDQLPQYADHGFAVFALRPDSHGRRGLLDWLRRRPAGAGEVHGVHPMAFRFLRRDPDQLFFPTVHVHDGEVHATAAFDHTLYLQATDADAGAVDWSWEASRSVAVRPAQAAEGVVARGVHVHRRRLRGMLPNRDQLVSFADGARRTRIAGAAAVQLEGPWQPADDALLDDLAGRLRDAAAGLGERARPFDAHLPVVTAGVAPPPLPPGLQLHTGPSLLAFDRALADGRHLRARVAVHSHPDASGLAMLSAALGATAARFA